MSAFRVAMGAVVAGAFLATAAPAAPKGDEQPNADVEFTHLGGRPQIFTIEARDGQKIRAKIKETCTDAFYYSFVGVERGEKTTTEGEKKALKDPDTKDLEITHDKQYGGYVVSISAKPEVNNAGDKCRGGEKMTPLSLLIAIREQDWNLSFSGGFTISGLTDPVFALKADSAKKIVIEEPDKADKRKLGAASFVHVGHDSISLHGIQPALAFGLGINADNGAEYTVGLGLRLGDKATLTVGRTWGSIARLPNGVKLNDAVTDDNVLNNLGRQTVQRWSFGISYSFIDTKDRLQKPFAETQPGGGGGARTGGGDRTDAAAGQLSLGVRKNIQGVATDPATYKDVPAIKKVLAPEGPATICKAEVSETAKVTLHLKDVGQALTGLKDAGEAARAAINNRIPGNTNPVTEPVEFVADDCGEAP